MFDITIGESDRRRGWHDVAKHVECCGNYSTSAEAQVSWLTSSAVVLLLTGTVPFYAVAEMPLSYGYCGSVASREAVRRELGEGGAKVMMSFQDDLRGFPPNGHRLKMTQGC
jgi:hypothetical protein